MKVAGAKKLAVLVLVLWAQILLAQTTIVKGRISDVRTKEALSFVTVFFDESGISTQTDGNGDYMISAEKEYTKLKIITMGYKPKSLDVVPGKEQVIDIRLEPEIKELKEVIIKSQKVKYRNKNNPAVELIRKVIEHKSSNRLESFDYYEFEKYEKIQFALSNVTEKFQNRKMFKKFQFVFDNLDTTKLKGKPVLPVFLKESLSDVRYRRSPKAKKEIIKGNKTVAFEGYVNNQGLDAYMKYLYQDINIYDNSITLLTNQFISPIANVSPTFYKFFISDTIREKGAAFVKLEFVPRNHSDFLFQGFMYVTLDSNYAVSKIDMGVNKDINLNWVKELRIVQEFENKAGQGYTLIQDELSADFGLTQGKMGFFGQRTNYYKNFVLNQKREDSFYKGDAVEVLDSADFKSNDYWTKNRHVELSKSEMGVYTTIDSVKKIPAFKRSLDVIVLLVAGYKTIGPYFDMGPVSTFYSFNPVEGFRLRFGGRTTTTFSERINFEAYGAYGFKDEKWKYYVGATYSLTKKNIYEFPVKSLKASYQRETKIPGQELQFIQEDNILLAFKRGTNNKWLYNDILSLEYLNEFKNHFSFAIGYKNLIQEPAGDLHYNLTDYNDRTTDIKRLQTSEFFLTLRWAPDEQFYQGKTYRIPISYKKPIFTLRYINGIKGFLGGEFNYQNISLNISKRFYLSQFGYTDVSAEAGKIIGIVPFPLLYIHRANQSYAYQLQSYNLMNFLEFASDQYFSLNIDHSFNGFFFNKIPLLRRLKWREALTLKMLYGNISTNNTPSETNSIYKFPVQTDGTPITYNLSKEPYVEGSVAIANIFKFFRVDLVKRFTYLDHPGISKLGLRLRFKFDF